MARWEPDARGRLEQAALALYAERGFEHTTVTEIAKRAGLTERTFFRHFADKREVLFAGSNALQEAIVSRVGESPASLPPIEAVADGLRAGAAVLEERVAAAARRHGRPPRAFARHRQAVVAASPELRERELIKLASLASALAETLRRRGLEDPAASLLAEIAVAVFRTAFEGWIDESNRRPLPELIDDALEQLELLTARASPLAAARP